MTTVAIESLFDDSRFPSGIKLLPLILYFPLGCVLAVIRIFIGIHVFLISCVLPKTSDIRSLVLRMMCTILGVVVKCQDWHNRKNTAKVIVGNNISTLDRLAVDLVIPSTMPSMWDLPPGLNWILGYTDMGVKEGRNKLIQNAQKHCQEASIPIMALPEAASTNARVGLLKFSIWPFSLGQSVQPIVITASRPVIPVLVSVLGGRWWLDTFWFLFSPFTLFTIRILPVEDKLIDEPEEEFSQRIQKLIAEKLKVAPTKHTSADKVEYAKRKLFIQHQAVIPQNSAYMRRVSGIGPTSARLNISSSKPNVNNQTEVMAHQVQEVLPHIPLEVITQDLGVTNDVDLTISNILEGKVKIPQKTPQKIQDPSLVPSKVKTFSKSPKERQMSFQERKLLMLAEAKTKYLENHGQSNS